MGSFSDTSLGKVKLLSVALFAFALGTVVGIIGYESASVPPVPHSAGSIAVAVLDHGVVQHIQQEEPMVIEQHIHTTPVIYEPGKAAVDSDDVWTQGKSNALLLPRTYAGAREAYDMVGDNRYALIKSGQTWDDFVNRSTEVALADGRGLIICPKPVREAGLGNALFATAGTVALAHRFGLLAVIPCAAKARLNSIGLKHMLCVDERAVQFSSLSDGGGHFDMKYQSTLEKRATAKPPMNTLIRGYFQYYRGFSHARETVCWALRPDRAAQQAAVKYLAEGALKDHIGTMTEDTSLVVAHVRRGDYGGKNKMHGYLSEHYYSHAWRMLQAQVGLENKAAGQNLIVLVFAMSNEVEWAKEHMLNKFPGAKAVIIVDPHQMGRGPEADIDMLAMSLATYFILANSTFSWWASFFSDCRRRLGNAWFETPLPWKSRQTKRPLVTLPHRWHVGRDTKFPETWQYMQHRYLVPGLFPLYENEDQVVDKKKKQQ